MTIIEAPTENVPTNKGPLKVAWYDESLRRVAIRARVADVLWGVVAEQPDDPLACLRGDGAEYLTFSASLALVKGIVEARSTKLPGTDKSSGYDLIVKQLVDASYTLAHEALTESPAAFLDSDISDPDMVAFYDQHSTPLPILETKEFVVIAA